ncbi:porin family protein [Reichenbachiella carrageenanivorans]|uniref:Porin family protein n=1 Tax=Reichenbachiella carrageenanivorans TaxID=2979869 RepID=A0ABY6D2Z4_9BACT|nr:porin family protein [Reichenbachiella carrageenanivorans]UXX80526.1 porin family protein [Reichenbachiella carrageenanivorans]
MRPLVLFALLLFTSTTHLYGQAIEFSAYGGYMLSGKSNYVGGEINVANGGAFGGTLGYDMGNGIQIQFVYARNQSGGILYNYFPRPGESERYDFDLVIEHFQLGAEKILGGNDLVKPYVVGGMGVVAYTPKNESPNDLNLNTATKFSGGLGLGVKIFPTEKIGLKFQAKMYMPLMFSGVGIFCGSGGCGGGSSFYVPVVHGEFSGGVVFRLEQ